MPYDLTLQTYSLPEWFAEPPREWDRRLREISPVTEKLSHLRFRYRAPRPDWANPDRGIWELYACTPAPMVHPERAAQFTRHWSELPQAEQMGRKTYVSSYQHYLWHVFHVDARRFWVLQGEWGGTAAAYTRREQRYLDACNAISDPFPLGFFAGCPFDERAVKKIQERDRFYQAGQKLDVLEAMDRPDAQKAEDDLVEREFRKLFLDNWYETIRPQAEYLSSYLRTSESDHTMRRATRAEADVVSQFKDHFIEFGSVPGAKPASSRRVQMAVK